MFGLTPKEAMRQWITGATPVLSFEQQITAWGSEYRDSLSSRSFHPPMDKTIAVLDERQKFIKEFGFAVPNAEALDLLTRYAPLIEIGAGSGSWSRLLLNRQVDVIATDAQIGIHKWPISYCDIIGMEGKTAVRRWPQRNVFCSWPSLNETWLRQAARAMHPGRVLLAVHEDAAADERTWDYIRSAFDEIADLELIGWFFCHDRLIVWKKRGKG